MNFNVILLVIIITFTVSSLGCRAVEPRYSLSNSNIYIKLHRSDKELKYVIARNDKIIQEVHLDKAYQKGVLRSQDDGKIVITTIENNSKIEFELLKDTGIESIIKISRNSIKKDQTVIDCVDLEIGKLNWFGGPQNRYQYWPIEKAKFTDYSYVSKEEDNCAITERYWLSSKGVFFFVDDDVPLYIEQNSNGFENLLCFKAKKQLPYNTFENSFNFSYKIGIASNAKEAQMLAVKSVLGKPSAYPDERMVRHPIWSTWALYKAPINDSVVRDFAKKILENKFNNSQFEIDDDWEDCYGALTFRKEKFPNIKELTTHLKSLKFRVTLWIHPFINKNCTKIYKEAKEKGYLVLNQNGNPETKWWNSIKNDAAYIDFTNSDAVDWFSKRLKRLQTEDGIDSFKFDAGESSWTPIDPVLNGPKNLHPSAITREYVKAVSKFGGMVEVRSGQGTQSLPIFLRMIDKDTNWSWNNGLPTLITTLLQLNLVGYSFILPDMIGGNGYNKVIPDSEIFIRWLQANVFMPSMQYSFVPWMYNNKTVTDICRKFTKLHDHYTNDIMERFKLVTKTGEPVNPPIWWIDPEDRIALEVHDEFLLGDKILVAPVIQKGRTDRDIYLPKGKWKDANNETVIYKGPKWLMNYPAPLDILPYFLKIA